MSSRDLRTAPSELLVAALGAVAVLIAALAGDLDSPTVWTLVAALGAGYVLSRGFARSAPPSQRAPLSSPSPPEARPAAAEDVTTRAFAPSAAAEEPSQAGVTLSEERVRVDRRSRPREHVRLVKHVVTEEVVVRVPVRREEIRVERVPAGERFPPTDGEVISEVTLTEEEPAVDTQVVARREGIDIQHNQPGAT
jgi:uncharacterized protein (TIGR02271 family)